MASQVLQASEAFIAGLTGVRPLPGVAAQVTLQVCLPLHRVCTKGAFEAHNGVGVCKEEEKQFRAFLFVPWISLFLASLEGYTHPSLLMMMYVIPFLTLKR